MLNAICSHLRCRAIFVSVTTATIGGGLRQRKQARLREEIRRTALLLFRERGFEETSVPDIAAAVEISPATVFRYFGTKADIVFGAKQLRLAALSDALAAQPRIASPLHVARSAMRIWNARLEQDELELDAQRLIVKTPSLSVESTFLSATICKLIARELIGRLAEPNAEIDSNAYAIAAVWPGFAAHNRWAEEKGTRPADSVLVEAYSIVDAAARQEPFSEPLDTPETGRSAMVQEVRSELLGLRARKAYRLRSSLVRAGLRLFAERGYHATTIDDIVAQADVSRRTFFRYFASKDDILLSGPTNRADRLRELVRMRPAAEGPLTAARQALWILLTATYGGDDPVMLQYGDLLMRSPDFRRHLMKVRNVWGSVLGEILAERMSCEKTALAPNAIGITAQWASHDAQERWLVNSATQRIGQCLDASFAALQRACVA